MYAPQVSIFENDSFEAGGQMWEGMVKGLAAPEITSNHSTYQPACLFHRPLRPETISDSSPWIHLSVDLKIVEGKVI